MLEGSKQLITFLVESLKGQDGKSFAQTLVQSPALTEYNRDLVLEELKGTQYREICAILRTRKRESESVIGDDHPGKLMKTPVTMETMFGELKQLREEFDKRLMNIEMKENINIIKDAYMAPISLMEAIPNDYVDVKKGLDELNTEGSCTYIDPLLLTYKPTDLQERFTSSSTQGMGETKRIPIMKSKAYQEIKELLDDNDEKIKRGNLFAVLQGPVGIGKSFGLALNVLEIRKNKHYLVLYISDLNRASADVIMPQFYHMLQFADIHDTVKVKSFYNLLHRTFDLTTTPEFINYFTFVTRDLENDKTKSFCKLLQAAQQAFEMPLILVADQAHAARACRKNIFNILLDEVLVNRPKKINFLVCTSRDWPSEPSSMLSRDIEQVLEGCFNDAEAEFFISENIKDKGQLTTELRSNLKALSEGVPYELFLICKAYEDSTNKDYEDVKLKYSTSRRREILKLHKYFIDHFQKSINGWYVCLAKKSLGISLLASDGPIDQNLCCKKGTFGKYQLEFYSTVYWDCIKAEYRQAIQKASEELLNQK